jgi:hypothetical protein
MSRPSGEARRYIGQKEILGNKGFVDPKFEAEMREEGFQIGYAWCALFAKIVYINCYPEKEKELRKLMVPGVLNTYRNLRDAAYPIGELPQIDSLVIWAQVKNGKETGFGHAGICSGLIENGFKSIEGNTSDESVREGYIVRENTHKLAEKGRLNGLKLKAFIHIPPPTTVILNV